MKKVSYAFLRIIKLCLIPLVLLAFASCSNNEEDGSVCLNIPSSVCQRLAARSVAGATMTVFVTGDYEAKKTVSYSSESMLDGDSITVEFDGIRAGSKVRVVCLSGSDGDAYIMIGASDEVTIVGGEENAASVKLASVSLAVTGESDFPPFSMSLSNANLPGCTYKWYFKSPSYADPPNNKELTLTTTEPQCSFAEYGVDAGSYFNEDDATRSCTIYCNGTKIVTIVPYTA